jgi:hypothetical protein
MGRMSRVQFPVWTGIFLFTTISRLAHTSSYGVGTWSAKQTSAEVKNAWSFTSTPLYTFTVQYLGTGTPLRLPFKGV